MSMRDYPVDEYGLYLDEKVMKLLASKICDEYDENEYDIYPHEFNEVAMESIGRIDYISNFCGEAIIINDDGSNDYSSGENYNDDMVYFCTANNYPSLFKAAYDNMDELVAEFKEVFEDYLPEDFDYRGHLRHLVGTYYG